MHFCQLFCSNIEKLLTSWMDVHPFLSVVLICSSAGERLTYWMGVHRFLSVVLICSSTGEQLTAWIGVHPFLSMVLICSSTGERLTSWMGVHPILSVVLICSTAGETHCLMVVGPFLSEVDLIKFDEQLTRLINVYAFLSVVLLKCWRVTHFLDGRSPILVSGSVLLNY